MASIHKVVNGDELVYPATITDAVGHKETKSPLSDLINYYNADLIWPRNDGPYHNLGELITKLYDALDSKHRISGVQLGFLSTPDNPMSGPVYKRYEYFGGESGEKFKQTRYWRRVDSGVLDDIDRVLNPIKVSVTGSPSIVGVSNDQVTVNLRVSVTKGGAPYDLSTEDSIICDVEGNQLTNLSFSRPVQDQFTPRTSGNREYNFLLMLGGKDYTATYTVRIVHPCYYGILADGDPIPTSTTGLTKVLNPSKGYTWSGINMVNSRTCYMYPKDFGKLTTIKDANNFEYINSYTLTERTINGVSYYIYTLTDPVTITNFKQSFG